jgi:hypothetical protein
MIQEILKSHNSIRIDAMTRASIWLLYLLFLSACSSTKVVSADIVPFMEVSQHAANNDQAVISAENIVPYRSKSGTYIYVEKGSDTPVIEGEWDRAYLFSDGLARVLKDHKYGYINTKGEFIVPLFYESAEDFDQGVAVVGYSEDDEFPLQGMINVDGELITPMVYEQFGQISENFRSVLLEGKVGFVDLKGKLRIPLKFSESDYSLPDFHEGLCAIENPEEEYATTFGFIDTLGNFLLDPTYDLWGGAAAYYSPIFSDGLCVFKKEDKYGYMDRTGKVKIPAIYDAADEFSEGLAPVRLDTIVIFINTKGEQAFNLVLGTTDEGVAGFYYPGFKNGRAIVNLSLEHDAINDAGYHYYKWEPGLIDKYGTILLRGKAIPEIDDDNFSYIKEFRDSTSLIRCILNDKSILLNSEIYVEKSHFSNYLMIGYDWDWREADYYFIDENGFEYRAE